MQGAIMDSSSTTSSKNTAIVSISLGIFCLASGASTLYVAAVFVVTLLQVLVCLYYDSLVVLATNVMHSKKQVTSSSTTCSSVDGGEESSSTSPPPRDVIVDELFPEVVRDRLYQQKQMILEQLILDSYPEATVLFADLVGYTSWSASRSTPHDVFVLLETLYAAFDDLAALHGIFKVETIGDCYLAMAGAPVPDPLHAQHMVQFSLDMMVAAHRILTIELADTLDTAHLQLRVGLHSGPIVAGVLRGAKSRFQVFGDTINTASRMESTSLPSGIQVSRAVRDHLTGLLTADSPEQEQNFILKSRAELVDAKGKGKLKTYFVESVAVEAPPDEMEETEDDTEDDFDFSSSSWSSSTMTKTASHQMCSGLDDLTEDEEYDPRAQFGLASPQALKQSSRAAAVMSSSTRLSSQHINSSNADLRQSMGSLRISNYMLSSIDDCFCLRSVEFRYE